MDITISMLTTIMPGSKKVGGKYLRYLNDTMRK